MRMTENGGERSIALAGTVVADYWYFVRPRCKDNKYEIMFSTVTHGGILNADRWRPLHRQWFKANVEYFELSMPKWSRYIDIKERKIIQEFIQDSSSGSSWLPVPFEAIEGAPSALWSILIIDMGRRPVGDETSAFGVYERFKNSFWNNIRIYYVLDETTPLKDVKCAHTIQANFDDFVLWCANNRHSLPSLFLSLPRSFESIDNDMTFFQEWRRRIGSSLILTNGGNNIWAYLNCCNKNANDNDYLKTRNCVHRIPVRRLSDEEAGSLIGAGDFFATQIATNDAWWNDEVSDCQSAIESMSNRREILVQAARSTEGYCRSLLPL